MPQSPRTRYRSPRARGLGGSRTAYTDWMVVKAKKHTVTGRTVEGGLVRLACSCGDFEKRVKRDQAFVTTARHADTPTRHHGARGSSTAHLTIGSAADR